VDPKQLMASYEQEISGLTARAEAAREEIKQLCCSATSQDGAVTVTVNGAGALQDVSFGQRADDLSRAGLAALIMETAHRAQARAAQQLVNIMTPLVGQDSGAMVEPAQRAAAGDPDEDAVGPDSTLSS
jgi:DNA-binding protein YbaB